MVSSIGTALTRPLAVRCLWPLTVLVGLDEHTYTSIGRVL
jgi:hypothetical protein